MVTVFVGKPKVQGKSSDQANVFFETSRQFSMKQSQVNEYEIG